MAYAKAQATIQDLYHVPENGKAEIVNGVLVVREPTGAMPGRAGFNITVSLWKMESKLNGRAYPDNVGFIVDLPNRQSFSPDAAFYVGNDAGMKFLEGAPVFSAEVRSESDYSKRAEEEMAQKRKDYFAAGTLVVWDVDLLSEDVVKVYRASDPEHPTIYRRGELAEAEPAVPGWRMPVDELFT